MTRKDVSNRENAAAVGKEAEDLVFELLKLKGGIIQDVRRDPFYQESDIDFIWTDKTTGQFLNIEVKADQWGPPNVVLEVAIRHANHSRPGYWLRTQADEVWYVYIRTTPPLLYTFNMKLLRSMYTLERLKRGVETGIFKARVHKHDGDGYEMDIVIVPIGHFPKYAICGPFPIMPNPDMMELPPEWQGKDGA